MYVAREAGLTMIPLFLPLSILAPSAGRLTARASPRLPMVAGLLTAGLDVALLLRRDPQSSVLAMLAALLLRGTGLGVLTPAVVAAGVSAVPSDRAALASAVNNTARQAGGAVGIAALGAPAETTAGRSDFVAGLHADAVVTIGLWTAATSGTLNSLP